MSIGTGEESNKNKSIKCLVWDLDNTLWEGVLLEDDRVSLRENVTILVKTLDERGILQSIASKNDYNGAMEKVREFGLQDYFLHPQINWGSKVSSIKVIAQTINIGLDAMAFIDDQVYEREEVKFSLPEVLCIDAADLDHLLAMPEMNPRFITKDTKRRRQMYLEDSKRKAAEEKFDGPREAFLASLNMTLTIFPAKEEDLKRAEELTVRTHQLNSTGYTYSYDELNKFRQSEHNILLMAHLVDKYGDYGIIGLMFVECSEEVWTIKLMLISCRVMSRGVGSIMLSHIMRLARSRSVKLYAEFIPTVRNQIMNITYRFSGFNEIGKEGDLIIFECDLKTIQSFPDYVNVQVIE